MTNPTPFLSLLGKALASEVKGLIDETASEMKGLFDETTRAAVADGIDSFLDTFVTPFLDADETGQPDVSAANDIDLAAVLARGAELEHELFDVTARARLNRAKAQRAEADLDTLQFEVDNLREVVKSIVDTVTTDEAAPALPLAVKGFAKYLEDSTVSFDDIRDRRTSVEEAIAEQQATNARLRAAIDDAHSDAARAHHEANDLLDAVARARGHRNTLTVALALPLTAAENYVMRVDEYQPRLNVAVENTNR